MLRRPISALLLAILVPQLLGCFNAVESTQRVQPARLNADELGQRGPQIVGVTTADGRSVVFDSLARRQSGDTLCAWLGGAPYCVRRTSVVRYLVGRAGEDPASVAPTELTRAVGSRIRGVTTTDGKRVAFDRTAGAYVARDTLFASASGEPFSLPIRQAREVWVQRTNAPLTALVTIAGTAALVGVLFSLKFTGVGPGWSGR